MVGGDQSIRLNKNMDTIEKKITKKQAEELLRTLKARFLKYMNRHQDLEWDMVQERLLENSSKLWSLHEMEITGGEPDVVVQDAHTGEYIFFDCSQESPKGRRSICYDQEALTSRKEYKPQNSALGMATEMGIDILDEKEYRFLQGLGNFDTKTSSWIETPADIRKLGGALFGDWRFGHVFIYHNGAESYYGARGFRGCLKV
jgi:hypothetical protein